jgi:hypothetical protein
MSHDVAVGDNLLASPHPERADSGLDRMTKEHVSMVDRLVWRSRWAAFGAAVAVSLGAGGVLFANAASPDSSTVMVTPVRILDTRDPVNVGLTGPLVSAIGLDLLVTGPIPTTTGSATVVPVGATGVILNVTVVGPTANGFLSVRPADAPGAPTTSSLNFSANESVPNAVTVQLPTAGADAGKIEITFDAYGVAGPQTDVLVDVVGYTTDDGLVALDARTDALEGRVTALETSTASLRNSVSAYAGGNSQVLVTQTDAVVLTLSLMPPANGKVIVNSSGYVIVTDTLGTRARCSITQGSLIDQAALQFTAIPAPSAFGDAQVIAGTRGFDVVGGVLFSVNLVCDKDSFQASLSNNTNISDAWLSAIFAPA